MAATFTCAVFFFFFFQAEDGIRDLIVTGVQTCALPICVLDLDRVDGVPAVEDEVDFQTCARAPEVDLVSGVLIGVPGAELLGDKTLQCRSPNFLRTVEGSLGTKTLKDAGVEKIELGMRD